MADTPTSSSPRPRGPERPRGPRSWWGLVVLLAAMAPGHADAQSPAPDDSVAAADSVALADSAASADSAATVPCEPTVYCDRWQTTGLFVYGASSEARRTRVRGVVDTLSAVAMEVPWRGRINQRYSPSHLGWDIDLDVGDTVRAAAGGRVRYTGFNRNGYGNVIMVRHPSGLETLYGHLQRILVGPLDDVAAGAPIGLGGSTGRSTGPHLHFEVRLEDLPLDPARFIGEAMGIAVASADTLAALEARVWAGGPDARRYERIRRGDTLSKIARRTGTTVQRLRQLNGLRPGHTIRAGRSLRVR